MVWMVGAIFSFVDLFLSGAAFLNHRKAQAALGWPATQGKVPASSVVRDKSGDSITYKADILPISPRIQYSYRVNNQQHLDLFGSSGLALPAGRKQNGP
jgi:hypothetical protein